MTVRERTKKIWSAMRDASMETVRAGLAEPTNDPPERALVAFSLYDTLAAVMATVDLQLSKVPDVPQEITWFKQTAIIELDAIARMFRQPLLAVIENYGHLFEFTVKLDDDAKPAEYHRLARSMLNRVKERAIRDNFAPLLDVLHGLAEKLKVFEGSIILSDIAEVKMGPIFTTKPTGPDANDFANAAFLKQTPAILIVDYAYEVTARAIEQYDFVAENIEIFENPLNCLLEHFALCEYLRIFAYKIVKNLKIEYYAAG